MAMEQRRVVIVGGGFSGAALAAYLLRFGPASVAIDIVEPRSRLGGGIAHDDVEMVHILNVPAEKMSLWGDRPLAFWNWAKQHGPQLGWPKTAGAGKGAYLPRSLFGHYMRAELEALRGPSSSRFCHHQSAAQYLAATDDGFELRLANGDGVLADVVVLATGFRPPAVPFKVRGEGGRLVVNPWQPGVFSAIGPKDRVLLVGTGLTMVDMVYGLNQAGHRGQIVALSRHGLLPRIHDQSEPSEPLISARDAALGVVHSLVKFRRALAQGASDWRTAADALRPIVDELWGALQPAEQDRFLRHLRPFWEVHRHRMPAESADLLLKLVGQGRLQVTAGRIGVADVGADKVDVQLALRGLGAVHGEAFDWVINCTPPAPPLAPGFDEFTQSLVSAGLVNSHRSGLGFDVDAQGQALNAAGSATPGLFVLGPPRRGHVIEATAVPHIRPQLAALTGVINSRLG